MNFNFSSDGPISSGAIATEYSGVIGTTPELETDEEFLHKCGIAP
jgi:hypothetical protein